MNKQSLIKSCNVSLQMQLDAANMEIEQLKRDLDTAERAVLSYDISKKEGARRDLEQQAKGIEDYANNQCNGLTATWMIAYAGKLRKQAEE